MATFSNAQVTRDQLSDLHPKQMKFNIIQISNYVHSAIKTLKAASTTGGMIMDQEILYFQFKIYKKIKAPAEWVAHMLFMEVQVASTPTYMPDTLFNEAQSRYTTLWNQGLWHPSHKSPEEQTLAMVVQQQQQHNKKNQVSGKPKMSSNQNTQNVDKEKKIPLFAQKQGKLGDTKQWNGETYHFCSTNHKHSHWHTHKVKDCNTFKKMNKTQSDKSVSTEPSGITNQVTVDKTKLKKGIAAIFPSGDFDTDDLAEALVTTMAGLK